MGTQAIDLNAISQDSIDLAKAAMAAANGVIYVATDETLYALAIP